MRHGAEPIDDRFVREELRRAFASAAGLRLRKAATESGKALILCDDTTRPTPTAKILPELSRLLTEAGVPASQQTILFAVGSHRAMTNAEVRIKVGDDLCGPLSFRCHDWHKRLVRVGFTPGGLPIDIDPLLGAYSCIVGIGSVFPHRYCGWSGGGKIVLPGVSGPESISRVHWLPYADESIRLGSCSNLAIRELRAAAEMAGVHFLIQCVCNGAGELYGIFAGEMAVVHDLAIAKAAMTLGTRTRAADVVIAQAYPEEMDLWQAGKALYAAENVVRQGGKIIVAASLAEGIGPHVRYAELLSASKEEILKYRNHYDENGLAAAASWLSYQVRRKAEVVFVTDNPYFGAMQKVSGIKIYRDMQNAVDYALRSCGAQNPIVALLKEAPLLLPITQEV